MKKFILIATSVAVCVGGVVQAEDRSLNYNEFIKEALVTSPEAAKIDASLAERIAEAFSTKVKDNPVLSADFNIPNSRRNDEKTDISITLSQAIRPSDFGDRTALAGVIEQTGDIEKQISLNEFIQNLGVLYARAWQFQETEILLTDARKRASQFLTKVSDGAKRGIFAEGDVELFRAEQKTFEADTIAAHAELSKAKADLIRLSGIAVQDGKLGKPNDSLLFTKDAIGQLVQNNELPLQRRLDLLKKLAQKQLEVARLDSFPAVSPVLGYGRHDDGVEQFVVGISIPLPVFNRNQSEKIKAQGALSAAERGQAYATSDALIAEVNLLYDATTGMRRQLEIYENDVVPAKKRAVDAYYRQFDAGIGTAFQLWQAQRELNASRLRTVELRSALTAAKAQISALVGQQF